MKIADCPANLAFVPMLVVVYLVNTTIISSAVLLKPRKIVLKRKYDAKKRIEQKDN